MWPGRLLRAGPTGKHCIANPAIPSGPIGVRDLPGGLLSSAPRFEPLTGWWRGRGLRPKTGVLEKPGAEGKGKKRGKFGVAQQRREEPVWETSQEIQTRTGPRAKRKEAGAKRRSFLGKKLYQNGKRSRLKFTRKTQKGGSEGGGGIETDAERGGKEPKEDKSGKKVGKARRKKKGQASKEKRAVLWVPRGVQATT